MRCTTSRRIRTGSVFETLKKILSLHISYTFSHGKNQVEMSKRITGREPVLRLPLGMLVMGSRMEAIVGGPVKRLGSVLTYILDFMRDGPAHEDEVHSVGSPRWLMG
ncbi:hypothetical protein ElyMa_004980600 [Elysia marginata]|uniref:Uncharacterized protein n=1 Tax=Elysia marginata TaxID=1093978 RepID=A0AAV4J5Y8_9GAST|nr:hypothetical protein ElyMa_004980600 [Elysia marginata]